MRENVIYKITNIKNNKVYIGQTRLGLLDRKYKHLYDLKTGRSTISKLLEAYNTYGQNNLLFEVVETLEKDCSRHELLTREGFWIDEYNAIENGYNSIHPFRPVPRELVEKRARNRKQTKPTLEQKLKNINSKKNKLSYEDAEVIRKLHKDGGELHAICDLYDIQPSTFREVIKRQIHLSKEEIIQKDYEQRNKEAQN